MLKIILETLDLAVQKVDRIRESNFELTNENRELLKKFSNIMKTSMKILIDFWANAPDLCDKKIQKQESLNKGFCRA